MSTAADTTGAPALVRTNERRYAIERDASVRRWAAAFPMLTVAERPTPALPDYVRLWFAGSAEIFQVDRYTAASGRDAIRIAPGAFGGVALARDAAVYWEEATQAEWNAFRTSRDRGLRLARLGLLVALVGVVIDFLFTAGEVVPRPMLVDPTLALALKFTKSLLLAVGFWLAWRAKVVEGSR